MDSVVLTLGIIILLVIILVAVFLRYVPLGLWIRALSSGVKIKISTLIGMRLRRISPHRLVDALIMVRKAGLNITVDQLEKHFLAGGNIERVAKAMISAQQANIDMTFEEEGKFDFKLWLIKRSIPLKKDNPIVCFARYLIAELENGKLRYTLDSDEGYSLYLTSEYFDEY